MQVTERSELFVPAPDFRLPAATRLGAVRLAIANLERSIDWYAGVLGLTPLRRDANTASLGVALGEAPLVHLEEHVEIAHDRRGQRRLGLYHFALRLPDRPSLGAFVQHLAACGEDAGSADHAVSEAIYLEDPDGLGVEVYADRPQSAWQEEEGALLLRTWPLDAADMVAAARGRSWTGAPQGTDLGHVHLHVGALDRALDFYHHALGFDRVRTRVPGAEFLSYGGYHHQLGINVWTGHVPPAGAQDARLLAWTVDLPDAATLHALGNRLVADGRLDPHCDRRESFMIADPWGTRVMLRAPNAT